MRSWLRGRPTTGAGPVRDAVLRYAAGAAVVLVVVVVAAVLVAGRVATREAQSHAERDARALAEQLVLPLGVDVLDPGDGRRSLDEAFAPSLEHGSLLRVKIWADAGEGHGRIVYSDDRLFQGARVPLGPQYALFASGEASAQRLTPQERGPDAFPAGTYEAYVGFTDARGTPFIVEAYLPEPTAAIGRAELLAQWLPLVVGSLVLFALATLPLAVGLARRTAAAEAERSQVVRRALTEAVADRRTLAQRLHDGPVQSLSGVALAMDSVDRSGVSAADGALLDRAAAIVRGGIGELRSVGDELFPDAVSADSLAAAVQELRRGLEADGVEVEVAVDDDLGLDADAAFVVYRVVREGLRNVSRHAQARRARLTVARAGADVVVTVADDGRGPGSSRGGAGGRGRAGEGAGGGLGLRLLAHEVRERAGSLVLGASDLGGSELRVRFTA